MCVAQYCGSVACAGVIQPPVTFEMKGISGGCILTDSTSLTKSSCIGSIIFEWKAWEVCRRRQATPFAARPRSNSATSGVGPATTQIAEPLTAASERLPLMMCLTSCSGSGTANIEPAGSF